jgi:hypothetical protein
MAHQGSSSRKPSDTGDAPTSGTPEATSHERAHRCPAAGQGFRPAGEEFVYRLSFSLDGKFWAFSTISLASS